jgi:branched-subunit amino acid aminotransferase/4-amino-4-deoxychorismate lyase
VSIAAICLTSNTSGCSVPSSQAHRTTHGFDDVLFTNSDTTISETATANIGFLDGTG